MQSAAAPTGDATRVSRPVFSVVVPVYNGGPEIGANIELIRDAVVGPLGEDAIEIVVVSDGSIDETVERLEGLSRPGVRVIHYDRNLGKGFAVKTGALAATGDWIGFIDADLDLDPAGLTSFLEVAQHERLDFAIGSKRHPESVVHYPRSRRIASWGYQQLNRVLFRLDVRDTQVGLKVFRRAIADEVVPLLLVKQFAFDLELLAVSRSLGYGRIRELPVRLDYRFTGSGVRSAAVVRALVDTAAIFYRLRVLRTYERKARLLGSTRTAAAFQPPVALVGVDDRVAELIDYPRLECVPTVDAASATILAIPVAGARPSGSWVSACVPYLARADVAAVVVPTMAPLRGDVRQRVAAATLESRFGGGSRRVRYVPGNVREVVDYPASSIVVRAADLADVTESGGDGDSLVAALAARGRAVVYTPDTMVVELPPRAFEPLVAAAIGHGRARGRAARRTGGRSLSLATAVALSPLVTLLAGLALLTFPGTRTAGLVALGVAAGVLGISALAAAMRFSSLATGLLVPASLLATEVGYAIGFARGLTARA